MIGLVLPSGCFGHYGIRTYRCLSCRIVSNKDSLYFDVIAVSYWQRYFWGARSIYRYKPL